MRLSSTILITGILVACFGLVAIYDASVVDAYRTFGDKFHYVKQQSIWIIIGIMFTCSLGMLLFFETKRWLR